MSPRLLRAVFLVWMPFTVTGCWGGFCGGWEDDGDWQESPEYAAPDFDVEVPSWPPVGRDTEIVVTATAEAGLSEVSASFGRTSSEYVDGNHASVTFYGGDFVDGFGDLQIEVTDVRGGWVDGGCDRPLDRSHASDCHYL